MINLVVRKVGHRRANAAAKVASREADHDRKVDHGAMATRRDRDHDRKVDRGAMGNGARVTVVPTVVNRVAVRRAKARVAASVLPSKGCVVRDSPVVSVRVRAPGNRARACPTPAWCLAVRGAAIRLDRTRMILVNVIPRCSG